MTAPAAAPRKPIILTVDDDPAVSRAVARDLRRKYAETYRIVRAENGPDALDTLRELKLRGDTVAVFVADYRMPAMSGIEFLEAAMDLYPMARRVLLTAYADTHAAIDAINVVDLDHYLLKPWDPPEEKLYPVIDALLEAWNADGGHPMPNTKIIGHRYSRRSSEVREFLASNRLPYHWIFADDDEGHRLLEAAGLDDRALPVVITETGEPLVDPSNTELAGRLGLSTEPRADFYDLAVIGGGPGGLAAAVYGASEGLRTVLIEAVATGGQAGQSSRIENYLGFPDGVRGDQLADRARRQAEKFSADLITTREAVALELHGNTRTIRFADGGSLDCRSVVLATGVSYRELDADGCHSRDGDDSSLIGRGVYYGAATYVAAECEDQEVYVVGGANSAGQAAMNLARKAARVHLVVRGPSLEASMSYYLIQQIEATPNIEVHTNTRVCRAFGGEGLENLTLIDGTTNQTTDVGCTQLFIFIGAQPRTDWLPDAIARDDRGFVLSGPDLKPDSGWPLDRPPHHLETSVPGVFVAGDVRAESAKRVAAAVGEGSMAVMFVHRYLAET
ncbi:FAD-dependent oxidoreductase [Mycolicibacterium confluentis]|uniref:Fused response regulator/thioredoxin-disulfide reductase n=1 Tax=Mycolicibacterium confluentis TaxID=28047 RepID=A0A7I7Y0R1_9MYCO|nr:FAD-dependent oxidoreductase [Mycolicibacterium confluentis]MCV7320115.1 FAD-dependent oxidoreductase [Mycolicibacterium confluentis]ORV34648.1 fused response regulator/thioredoxin-disulfide reductase [Mycolicibacterium confluentis]BBZ35149.1 fused response regulator/thioredoxin-disulfide reductase [Mycolicibacterium confluentis]